MENSEYMNYLTSENGAKVIDCSSNFKQNSGDHVLVDNRRSLWLTEGGLPQYIIFDISNLESNPKHYRCFGFDCWHDYQSNPKTIELKVSLNGDHYINWSTLNCELTAGTQFFDINKIPSSYVYLKVVITETFGENKTYLNQVFLLEFNPLNARDETEDELEQIYDNGSNYQNSRGSKVSKNQFRKNLSMNESQHIQYMEEENEDQVVTLQSLQMQMNGLVQQNKYLVDKVGFLEESLEEKEDQIKQFYKLIETMADQISDIRDEIYKEMESGREESKKVEQKLLNVRDQVEQKLDKKVEEMKEMIRLESTKSFMLSNSKASESTMRSKQKHIMSLMSKLQEKLALRDMKIAQLRTEYGDESVNNY